MFVYHCKYSLHMHNLRHGLGHRVLGGSLLKQTWSTRLVGHGKDLCTFVTNYIR